MKPKWRPVNETHVLLVLPALICWARACTISADCMKRCALIMTSSVELSADAMAFREQFTKATIKDMIERQQQTYNWQFTFLAANQDAFAEAGSMGMDAAGAANWAMDKVAQACMATGGKVARMRRQRQAGEAVSNEFTAKEREDMS